MTKPKEKAREKWITETMAGVTLYFLVKKSHLFRRTCVRNTEGKREKFEKQFHFT